jgi:phosphate-selective porin
MKRIGLLTLVIVVTVLLTLTFSAMASPKAAPIPAVAAAIPAVASPAPMPPHPHIDEALEAMHNAKHHLETADRDFHGHRRKAIEHLDAAIHEAEVCLQEP